MNHPTSFMPDWKCDHGGRRIRRDENLDRVRVVETCTTCGVYRHYCLAKRLDEESREAWGPVGVWSVIEAHLAYAQDYANAVELEGERAAIREETGELLAAGRELEELLDDGKPSGSRTMKELVAEVRRVMIHRGEGV